MVVLVEEEHEAVVESRLLVLVEGTLSFDFLFSLVNQVPEVYADSVFKLLLDLLSASRWS